MDAAHLISVSVLRFLGLRPGFQHRVTDEDIIGVLIEGEKAGLIHAAEREMIEDVLDLSDRAARTIMMPRPQLSASPAVAGEGIDMTALEIVAVTTGLFLNGCLAVSELRTDFSQHSRMKRLIAEGYARLRAARCRRRYHRRVHRKKKLRELSRGTVRNLQRPASKRKSRLHRKMLRHRAESQRRKEGEPAHNHDHAG